MSRCRRTREILRRSRIRTEDADALREQRLLVESEWRHYGSLDTGLSGYRWIEVVFPVYRPVNALQTCSEFLNMCAALSRPDTDQLFEFAEAQLGLFTTAQAVSAGYARSTHSYHVHAGNWVREHRGIYRLKRYPLEDKAQLALWTLWSRDREGKPQGVFSHLTALAMKDLSDANPPRLHMTVPPDFRRNSEIPKVLVLHKAVLAPDEIIRERGYALTTPMRAIRR